MVEPLPAGKQDQDATARGSWVRQVRTVLASLPAVQREVVELAYYERLSQVAIARRLAVPLSVVKVAVASALQRIADLLEHGPASS